MGERNIKINGLLIMKKIILLQILILSVGVSSSFSQCSYEKKKDVKLSSILLEYLGREKKDLNKLTLVDLTDENRKMYLASEIDARVDSVGIYQFGILASHPTIFICLVYSDSIKIIEDYSLHNLLSEVSYFYAVNAENFTLEQQIRCSIRTIQLIEARSKDDY